MNNLMIFEGKQVEIFNWNGKVLFNPKHVAECLELSEDARRKQIQRMNEKQVMMLKNSDVTNCPIRKLNNRGEKFLTESGVYKMIFASRSSETERFQDCVTDTVLPQIRQTGGYIPVNEEDSDEDLRYKSSNLKGQSIQKSNVKVFYGQRIKFKYQSLFKSLSKVLGVNLD